MATRWLPQTVNLTTEHRKVAMTTVSMKQPIAASTYPRELIALVRSLDCAEVCVRVADHYLGNLDRTIPSPITKAGPTRNGFMAIP